jgi:rhodanese-related sulfurtransferase
LQQVFEFIGNHPILVGVFIALVIALIVTERKKGGESINAQTLVRLVNKADAVVIDLRDKKEFSAGHIASAVNLPYASFANRTGEFNQYKERPVVLVCKMGQHSSAIGGKLIKEGFSDVKRLSGGMTEWMGSNLPVVK